MITLDKSLLNQRIICTISEIEMQAENVPILKVENKQSNINYTFNLPENTSLYKNRFDEFIFSTTEITAWPEGKYMYTIWEYNPTTQTLIQELEIGLLQVLGTTEEKQEEDFISIAATETDDDYAVYNGN